MKQVKNRSRAWLLAGTALLGACVMGTASAGQVYRDALDAQPSFDQFIVKFKSDSNAGRTPAMAANATARLASQSGRALSHQRRMGIGSDVIRVQGKPMNAKEAEDFMLKIAANPDVEYVQPDALMQLDFVPNDTRYTEQWHYVAGPAGMNLTTAWDQTNGAGVVVAVVDTGITTHSDLTPNIIAGYDMITDIERARDGDGRDSNPRDEGDWRVNGDCSSTTVTDSSWHGTHTAGTVGAVTNNGVGVSGVAFGAKIQPVRVMGKCGGSISDIADGVTWASGGSVPGVPMNATPAKVINMSLGGSGACDATYQAAIDGAVSRGTVVVVAAGNSNAAASGHRPANCNNVITVGALDRDGNRAFYSNYGPVVDIAAPGGETATSGYGVLSTFNTGLTVPANERYAFKQGTSMAAPHVAGLAALMLAKSSALTPAQVEATMKANVRAITGTCTEGCGAGVADAAKTLTALGTTTNVPPTPNFAFSTSGLTASFTDTSTDSDGTIASRSWSFGDGGTSTLANPTRTYASAGTRTVTLTVTDNKGAARSVSKSVTVSTTTTNTPPVANFTFTTSGLTASFTDTSTDANGTIASRSWNFGDATTSTLANPSKTYASAGTRTVTLTVTDNQGATNTVSKSVIVTATNSPPVANFTFTTSGLTASFTDTSTDAGGSIASRAWNFGDATTSTLANPSKTYAAAGTYTVSLTVTDNQGATNTVSKSVTVSTIVVGPFFQNLTDFPINDNSTVDSPITVTGVTGNAPSTLKIAVNIVHTWPSDLRVDLVAPDGSLYNIHNRTSTGTGGIVKTVTVNASSEVANGIWKLRVNDNVGGDTGYINSWSMQF